MFKLPWEMTGAWLVAIVFLIFALLFRAIARLFLRSRVGNVRMEVNEELVDVGQIRVIGYFFQCMFLLFCVLFLIALGVETGVIENGDPSPSTGKIELSPEQEKIWAKKLEELNKLPEEERKKRLLEMMKKAVNKR
ncbi:hypothetical protein [Candidatus Uabimicrobium amorphum]|uniref:Uncharacterized protein n=1 Tax=Uabimicrobium amorphum TaxID=2596890 RepID=A0A5S9F397_UABAM|nr:hypothetical protein [Candidatus Uabimicrobium amorphum]BBM84515.1 hypothetical protein UABAM_02876 [Candidatus Uabimicrobium amorphum]